MKKRKTPLCRIHKIPLVKRGIIRQGQSRFFCIKCEEERKGKTDRIR